MNKVVCKSLSLLMAVIMLFTAVPMLVSAEGEVTAPVFAVKTLSESPTELKLVLSLKSGSFQCFDATLTVDGTTCTSILLTNEYDAFVSQVKADGGSAADCTNKENGKISISVTESCTAPMDIAAYSFTKTDKDGVVGSDIHLSFESCYVDSEGESIVEDIVPDISVPETHTHICADDAWQVEVAATCTAEGTEKATCSACDEVFTRTIAKLPHDATKIETVPATCTVAGSKKTFCSVCNELISEEVLPATGHDTEEVRKEATCTENGYVRLVCKTCGDTISETVLEKTGHDTEELRKEATCTENGYIRVVCKTCGETISETVLEKTGHDTEEVRKEPTCTENGYIRVVCKTCGDIISETVLEKTGHGETRLESVAPTCTEDGYVRHYCSVCGDLINEVVLEKTGHSYIEESKTADCHETGYLKVYCSVCNHVATYFELQKTQHNWTSWATIKEPTYRSKGLQRRSCRICGDVEEKDIPMIAIPVTGVKISLDTLSMNYKQTSRLFANVLPEEAAYSADIVWSSSNPKIIAVDENGTITAVGKGTAEVTASTPDGKISDSCTVTVTYSWIQKIIVYLLFGWLWY